MEAVNNRVVVNSMETRGCLAAWDGDELRFWYASQGVLKLVDEFAKKLKLPKEKLHVFTPDVGGAFGMKNFNYPEYFMAGHASMRLKRPVKWISDRSEGFLSDCMGRDNITRLTMGFDEANRITGFKTEVVSNLGAYNSPFGVIMQSQLYSRVLTGVYDIQTVWMETKGVFTNTVPTDAYRGAGRPEAQYSIERFMDYAARELGVAPDELRRINFIKPDQFPYQTATGESYDVGDFARVMERGLREADWAGLRGAPGRERARRQAARARPRPLHRGDPRRAEGGRRDRVRRRRHGRAARRHPVERPGPRDRLHADPAPACRHPLREDPRAAGRQPARCPSAAAPAARAASPASRTPSTAPSRTWSPRCARWPRRSSRSPAPISNGGTAPSASPARTGPST